MGLLPAQVWALTPRDTALLVAGHNEAQGPNANGPAPMSEARLGELMRLYPDE